MPTLFAVADRVSLTGTTKLTDMPEFRGPSRLRKEAYKDIQHIPMPKVTNKRKRTIKKATLTINAYAQSISTALKVQIKAFRDHLRGLSPFELELAQLTIAALEREGAKSLRDVISDFDLMRRAVVRTGKEASAEVLEAESVRAAEELMDAGVARVEDIFDEESEALFSLIGVPPSLPPSHPLSLPPALPPSLSPSLPPSSNFSGDLLLAAAAPDTANRLRGLPRPVLEEPVLVLVGMPNVGKSSLVTATSTGKPEINDYPFTTRRLKLGHVEDADGSRYQMMDTPGVLHRSEEERNAMEGLTLAAVQHLPSAVVFVMDLSGTCGAQSDPKLQLQVLAPRLRLVCAMSIFALRA